MIMFINIFDGSHSGKKAVSISIVSVGDVSSDSRQCRHLNPIMIPVTISFHAISSQ